MRRRRALAVAAGALPVGLVLILLLGWPEGVEHHGLRVICQGETVRPGEEGRDFVLLPARVAELAVDAPAPLRALRLDFDSRGPSRLSAAGWRLGERLFRPDGSVVIELLPETSPELVRPWARFWRPAYRYPLRFTLPKARSGPVRFTLRGITADPVAAAAGSISRTP